MLQLLNAETITATTLSNHNCKECLMDRSNKETTGENHGHKELLIIHRKTNLLSTGLHFKRKIQMPLNLPSDIMIRWDNGPQVHGHILTAPLMMDLMIMKLLILCIKSITFDHSQLIIFSIFDFQIYLRIFNYFNCS